MHSTKLPGQPLVFMESVQYKPVWSTRVSESIKNGGLLQKLWRNCASELQTKCLVRLEY